MFLNLTVKIGISRQEPNIVSISNFGYIPGCISNFRSMRDIPVGETPTGSGIMCRCLVLNPGGQARHTNDRGYVQQ